MRLWAQLLQAWYVIKRMANQFSAVATASTVVVIATKFGGMMDVAEKNINVSLEDTGFSRTQMQKDAIILKLKEQGGRITKQRLMLLDIILEEECSSCKEIYYRAVKKDAKIGVATVYRMVNTLEEIGAINRKNMYKIAF